MKVLKRWMVVLVLLGLAFSATITFADYGTFGDDDPFPVACINFSGTWRSDLGAEYIIGQTKCNRIRITVKLDSKDDAVTTIVPDNRTRKISGNAWKGSVRSKWNGKKRGTILETYRTIHFAEYTITEVIMLERVNDKLLLENVIRVIKMAGDGEPLREYGQHLYRRVAR